MRREHDWGEDDPSDAYWSWSVRLNLASGAAATAKLTLDAALAGYYSPAYGLLRHLAERPLLGKEDDVFERSR